MTLNEMVAEYIANCDRLGRSAATLRNYRQQARYIFSCAFGNTEVSLLTTRLINQFYRGMHDDGKGATYIRRCHALMTATLEAALKEDGELLPSNPFRNATPPREPRHQIHAPTVQQVQDIINAAKEPWSLMFRIAATTGMRRGEICGLKWTDIDWEEGTITVRRSITRGSVVGETKTHRDRVTTVGPGLLNKLAVRRAALPGVDSWVFGAGYNMPMEPDHATRAFSKVCARLGITGITLHTFRHFAATQLIASGADPKTVADRLGHSDVKITMDIYTDVLSEKARQAGDYLEGLLK